MERLLREIRNYKDSPFVFENVQTIYWGGGTPSLLEPKQIERILTAIGDVFSLDIREVTFEVNPDDVNAEFLQALHSLGITRLSMGVQTFQPDLLDFMNRAHSRDEALVCLELLQKSAFESFTVDLIYGNPGQSLEELNRDLDLLLGFNPPHVSAYSLTIEAETRLGKQVELGRIVPPEDDRVADHFDLINDRLSARKIERYEVSNYSKAGCEAVHNSSYWRHQNYLGLGPGAHSFWWDEEAIRWEHKRELRAYLKGEDTRSDREVLGLEQLAEERLMMGLRTREGITTEELDKQYDYQLNERQQSYLRAREEEQKLVFGSRIKLTDSGIKIADAIILDIITLH